MSGNRRRLHPLADELARTHPHLRHSDELIASGRVLVDNRVVTNPRSLVRSGAAIAIRRDEPLRGEAKLAAALRCFAVDATGRTALDVGAAAGGFTRVLLAAGARRVYAVDAGHGQLVGSLRQDPRVVNLEGVNLGDLDTQLVPEPIDLFTLDLSYLALANAAPQLEAVHIADAADLVALVKPMFELRLAAPPTDGSLLRAALGAAAAGFAASGWTVAGSTRSPVAGARGAIELLLHVRRQRGFSARSAVSAILCAQQRTETTNEGSRR